MMNAAVRIVWVRDKTNDSLNVGRLEIGLAADRAWHRRNMADCASASTAVLNAALKMFKGSGGGAPGDLGHGI